MFNMLRKLKHLKKMIKLPRRGKIDGLYSFYNGSERQVYTNYRKYTKEINQHERELNRNALLIIDKIVRKLHVLENPIHDLDEIANDLAHISDVYKYSNRGLENDSYRINNMIMNLTEKYMT